MSETRPSRNERVLVVEDDSGVGEAVQLVLRQLGCHAEVVTRAASGLERARSGEFDLLVTDLRLPDRDGLSIIRDITAGGLDLPMI